MTIRFRLMLTLCALLAGARTLHAQAPLPAEIPWNAPPSAVRALFARMGLHAPRAQATDSTRVFTRQGESSTGVMRARFRGGRLWHVFYVAEGDSAALQRDLERSSAAATARYGQATRDADGARVWTVPGERRFVLPAAPVRGEGGRFTYAVVYHRG